MSLIASSAIKTLQENSLKNSQLIKFLKMEIAASTIINNDQELITENEQLKQDILVLKSKLIELEAKNGRKLIQSSSSSQSNKSITTSVALPQINNALSQVIKNVINESKNPIESSEIINNEQNKAKTNPKKNQGDKEKALKQHNATDSSSNSKDINSETKVDVSRLNMRIGKIVKVEKHPDADSLYVEQVDVGEANLRTVVSGLVKHVPIEMLQDRVAVFLLNLKAAKMRGVMSEGMIMCASSPEKVEVILPPEGVVIGERVVVDGYPGEPDDQLNPKKKTWEQIQPDLKINSDGLATYKDALWRIEDKGTFKAPSMINSSIK